MSSENDRWTAAEETAEKLDRRLRFTPDHYHVIQELSSEGVWTVVGRWPFVAGLGDGDGLPDLMPWLEDVSTFEVNRADNYAEWVPAMGPAPVWRVAVGELTDQQLSEALEAWIVENF